MGVYNHRTLLGGILSPIKAHIKHLARDPMYRNLISASKELRRTPRFSKGSFLIGDLPVKFIDNASALNAYDEIFVNRIYDIGEVESPYLVDVGANIGLAALYFKHRYDTVSGICFEPDPNITPVLKQNLTTWGCADIEVCQAAVGSGSGKLTFHQEGADGGRVLQNVEVSSASCIEVPCVQLSSYLRRPVDLLKIDVEGAELEVFREIAGSLGQVHRVFVEIHSFVGQTQAYWEIFKVLQEAGFRCYPKEVIVQQRPFDVKPVGDNNQFDVCLNVSAVR